MEIMIQKKKSARDTAVGGGEREEKTFQEFPQILINRSNSLAQEIASYQKGLPVPVNDWVVNNVVQNKKVLESSNILDTHQHIAPFLTVKAL